MADLATDKLKKLLARDDQYDRFKDIVKKYSMHAELESLVEEVFTLHRTRKTRKLHSIKPNPRDVIDASLEDSSYRSRAVEILMRMMRSQRAIQRAIDNISGYILTQYGDYIEGRTKAERERAIRNVNTRAIFYLDELESAIEVLREFIVDCDKAGYAVKSAIEGLKIVYGRENVVS